jgi:outer membrane receptor protein involved in Fe transport
MTLRIVVSCVLCSFTSIAPTLAQASIKHSIEISQQQLGPALAELARQTRIQVVYSTDLVQGQRTAGLSGTMTPEEALGQLLSKTGLRYEFLDAQTVTLSREGGSGTRPATPAAAPSPGASIGTESSSWQRFRVARLDSQQSAAGAATASGGDAARGGLDGQLEEIIVTATKRTERLIDAPQSVTVLSSEVIARLGATQFRDFANTIPGLSFTTTGAGSNQISLRGVTTGLYNNPTVGIYMDDVPVGSSTAFGFGARLALDPGLFDIERIEVLRGPQGTLYGASAMGGLLKYVTRAPSTDAFGIETQLGLSNTRDGSVNYNGAMALNAPIASGKAALRATAFYSRDGGYTDNLALGREDVDRANIYGGRANLLLTPTDTFQIQIGAFAQNISRDGKASSDFAFSGRPVAGDLEHSRPIAEPWEQRLRLVSVKADYDFGTAKLSSISAYQTIDTETVFDTSALFVPLIDLRYGVEYGGVGLPDVTSTDKFTQELRLASSGDQKLEWLVGVFYTDEKSSVTEAFAPIDLTGQPVSNTLYTFYNPTSYEEYAAFGDVTYHFTDRFDVSVGTRYARNRQVFRQEGNGDFGATTPTLRASEDVFTYLANARYHFGERATGYLRYATGYRPGGANFVGFDPGAPTQFEADRLKSYEAGYKAETSDRRFGIDAAVYHIDWNKLQVSRALSGFDNAGEAAIDGLELTLTARPIRNFELTAALAFQDARLEEASADLGARKHEQLPDVADFTGALTADYWFASSSLQPSIGLTARHVGERMASFDESTRFPQYRLPSYTSIDLRTGVMFDSVTLQFYVHNVFDERGQLSAFNGYSMFGGPAQISILRPRTIGVTATTRF